MKLRANTKLLMIGDSITDCGRRQPIGEGQGALGNGYVSIVDAMLNAVYPEREIRVVNTGTSGHTVRDLKARWSRDVLELGPDWLSVMIGINDVWRQFDQPTIKESHVYLEEYERTLTELVERTRSRVQGLVLMTPFYIEPYEGDAMRTTMDLYGNAVKRIAEANDTIFVDTQAAFNKVLQHVYPATLALDRVHPGMTGHMVLAKAFLDAIEFSWHG